MAACIAANNDKSDPAAYCAELMRRTEEHCKGQNMSLNTADILGVEIFQVGTHNGQKYTEADLDEIVRAFQEMRNSGDGGYSPPIKLDHADGQPLFDDVPQDGGPAFGWVDNLRRVGEKLVADFKAVPAKLKDLIDAGAYRGRSAEIWWNLEVGGKKYARALKAVALLGVKMPAVRSLRDITKLYEGKPAFEYDAEHGAGVHVVWGFEEHGMDEMKSLMQKAMDAMKEMMGMMGKMPKEEEHKEGEHSEDFAEAIEGSWDGAAAVRRIRAWATTNGKINFGKFRRAFAMVDGPEDNVGSYKFPHHDIREGELVLHKGGVRAALAAAGGARSGQANPAAQRHMAVHKEAMGMEVEMDGVTLQEFEELKTRYEAQFSELKGKVEILTAENKSLGEANTSLQKRQMERWVSDTVREWPGDIESNRKRLLTFAERFGQDSEEVREYIAHEDASAKMLKESGLFQEVGSSHRGHLDVSDEMEAEIKKYTDTGKSRVEAIRAVTQENPRLYAEHAKTVQG